MLHFFNSPFRIALLPSPDFSTADGGPAAAGRMTLNPSLRNDNPRSILLLWVLLLEQDGRIVRAGHSTRTSQESEVRRLEEFESHGFTPCN